MPRPSVTLAAMALAMLTGCSSLQVKDNVLASDPPLCQPQRPPLGAIAVLPETRWRPDQKEPAVRQAIAQSALEEVFSAGPGGCPAAIRPFATWSLEPERQVLSREAAAGVDTVIFLQVEELGPLVYLSFPVLWTMLSEVKLRFRAVSTHTGEIYLDVRRQRKVGGPFELRGLAPLQGEMATTLRELLGVTLKNS